MYVLGIDLGTTFSAAAIWRDGHAEVVSLGSRGAAIPSVVLLRQDETIVTGEAANRRALTEPHRVAREFKRRVGDTTPLLLGGTPYSAEALSGRLLRSVVDEVVTREGGQPSAICVCYPANWGPYKTDLLRQAVRIADLEPPVTLITEPEAAAVFYAHQQRLEAGAVVAVYDLGGGTFDAAVLRKTATGFTLLGQPEGIERLGGIDFDAAVFAHVSKAIGGALAELDEDDPAAIAAVARLREECTQAKEALSADTDATVPVLLPNLVTEVRLTRAELEAMVRPALHDTIAALRRALRSAGVSAEELQSVLLVGGSSRIPVVAQMVGSELGRPVTVDAHPKHAIALGAAWVASGAPAESPQPSPAAPPVQPAAAPTPPTTTPRGISQPSSAQVPSAGVPPVEEPQPSAPTRSAPTTVPTGSQQRHSAAEFPLAPTPPAPAPAHRRRSLLVPALAAGVVAVLAGGAFAWAQLDTDGSGGSTTGGGTPSASPSPSATTSTAPTPSPTASAQPADELCTDAIQANTRWVCLTQATFDGTTLTIDYTAEFAGSTPNVSGGFHLHVYGGDGVTPPDEIMGTHADSPGAWYVEDKNPSVRRASSDDYQSAIGDAPKVCARIANSKHQLVPDSDGGFATGNCVPITRL